MLEIKASLRIYAKGTSLSEISSKFRDSHDFGYSEGDGMYAKNRYLETMWGKRSTCGGDADINTHVVELLDWLELRKKEFCKLTVESSVKSDIFVFLSSDNGQGGMTISSDVLIKLSEYELDFVIDVYS